MQVLERSQALAIAPLWRLGFRPFFLGGALFALLAMAAWVAALSGWLVLQPLGGWLVWHRHEMPFGFGLAIIAGLAGKYRARAKAFAKYRKQDAKNVARYNVKEM